MPTVISVTPEGSAWAVRCPDVFDNPLLFRSGARAEAAARRLSENLSRGGLDCLLELRLRDGALAGRFLCPAVSAEVRPLPRAA
jgi:hypothetical protein